MDLHLDGKTAVVVGASRGIGKYVADALAREGCNLAICARSSDTLEETAEELRERGADVVAEPMDITEEGAPARMIEATVDRLGRLDVLVNNVGGNRRKPFDELTDQDWDDLMNLNFMSHVRCSREAIPHMRDGGGGAIIFMSSIFGREVGGAGLSLYNTTKSALISVSKIMAQELSGEGIRVNTVAPGSIRFPGGSWDRRYKEDPEAMEAFIEENLPIGRFGRAEEVADLVAFLASDRSSLLTGSCINIDGGQSKSLI